MSFSLFLQDYIRIVLVVIIIISATEKLQFVQLHYMYVMNVVVKRMICSIYLLVGVQGYSQKKISIFVVF